MTNEFSIETSDYAGFPVLKLVGDVTSESDDAINRAYRTEVSAGRDRIVIDFARTTYINSAGMATLLGLVTDMLDNQRVIRFVGLSPHFKKIVEMIGIAEYVTILGTVEEAIESFAKG